MKTALLSFLALLLTECGQKPEQTATAETPIENRAERATRIPGEFYGMTPSNILAKVVSEFHAIQGALVITDMRGKIVTLAGQPPKQKYDDYDFWNHVGKTYNDWSYKDCKEFSRGRIGQIFSELYPVYIHTGLTSYRLPICYEEITAYYPAENPQCRIFMLIERETNYADDDNRHPGVEFIKYLLDSL